MSLGRLTFNNIALAVEDVEGMADWYCGMLALSRGEAGRFDAVGADFVMLVGSDFRLELVSRGRPGVWPDRTSPPEHLDVLGYKALVLNTNDLRATTTCLMEADVEIVWADRELAPARRSTMIRDPEGNLINIFGPSPNSAGV